MGYARGGRPKDAETFIRGEAGVACLRRSRVGVAASKVRMLAGYAGVKDAESVNIIKIFLPFIKVILFPEACMHDSILITPANLPKSTEINKKSEFSISIVPQSA